MINYGIYLDCIYFCYKLLVIKYDNIIFIIKYRINYTFKKNVIIIIILK